MRFEALQWNHDQDCPTLRPGSSRRMYGMAVRRTRVEVPPGFIGAQGNVAQDFRNKWKCSSAGTDRHLLGLSPG